MSLIGGLRSGLGGVRTTGEASGGSSPTPPTPSAAALFDLSLSYGHGMTVDENLPDNTSFWLSPTTIGDIAAGVPPWQVREWLVDQALSFVGLDLVVEFTDFPGRTLPVIVTINGLDTALSIVVPDAVSTQLTLQASAFLAVAAGSTIGVRVDGTLIDSGLLVMQARLHGAATGTPTIPDTLPVNALALFRPEDLATDGTRWVDSVAGHLYTATVPAPTGPPPPGIDPVEGPARVVDGSFNGAAYAYFRNYTGPFGQIYTPCMLASSVSMFTGVDPPPIAPRTVVAVCRPDSSIGGIAFVTSRGSHSFTAALRRPTGNPTQAVYWNLLQDLVQTDNLATPANYAAQELICIWRTDGTTLEFFINGVKQTLDDDTIGQDFAARVGCTIGNLEAEGFSSQDGWQGAICFEGVWARKFSNAEVLSATANLAGLYVTP